MNIIQLPQTELLQTELPQHLQRIEQLAGRVFDGIDSDYIKWRITHMPDLSTFVAEEKDEWAGFKIGYAMTKRRYYSWLGGVDPKYRGLGVASRLMEAQHTWLKETQYQVVETHIRRDNQAMFLTNQKAGFVIKGRFYKGNELNLILQKDL